MNPVRLPVSVAVHGNAGIDQRANGKSRRTLSEMKTGLIVGGISNKTNVAASITPTGIAGFPETPRHSRRPGSGRTVLKTPESADFHPAGQRILLRQIPDWGYRARPGKKRNLKRKKPRRITLRGFFESASIDFVSSRLSRRCYQGWQ